MKLVDSTDLLGRLAALEDTMAILAIEGAYGPAYDGRQPERWAALFTEDGVYEARAVEGLPAGNRVQGRENLARFCREEPLGGMHFINIPDITLTEDTARVRAHFQYSAQGPDALGGIQSRSVHGYYDSLYEKADGNWHIGHRVTNYLQAVRSTALDYRPDPAEMAKSSGGPDDPPLYRDARG